MDRGQVDPHLLKLAYASLRVTLPSLPISFLIVRNLVRGVADQFFCRAGSQDILEFFARVLVILHAGRPSQQRDDPQTSPASRLDSVPAFLCTQFHAVRNDFVAWR